MERFLHAIAARAAEAPGRDAAVDVARGAAISRGGLEAASDLLAEGLAALDLPRGATVAHMGGPGTPRIVAFTAAWKAGFAFAPLDPVLPDAQIAAVVEEIGVRAAILDDADGRGRFGEGMPVLVPPAPETVRPGEAPPFARRPPDAGMRVAVRFTSGSSGRPKAVELHHEANEALFDLYDTLQLWTPKDRPCLTGSWWIHTYLTTLMAGATLTVADFARLGPAGLAETLDARRITHLRTFTAAFRALAAAGAGPFADLRTLILSGEALTAEDAAAFERMTLPGAVLRNSYGSNEAPLMTTHDHRHGDAVAPTGMPLGPPDRPGVVAVLDPSGAPAAVGEIGEIVARGRHIARGWIGRPQETAAAFEETDEPGVRRWRTGDLGWFDAAGVLHAAGRIDDQVKIRGYAVRLIEVERALVALPGVAEAAASAWEGPGGARRLAAHVVPEAGARLDPSALRAALAQAHPGWMVPGRIRVVAELPRIGVARKLHRAALPDPFAEPAHDGEGEGGPPRGEVETLVAEAWREALGAGGFGREDDFFDIGGDSLQAMAMALGCERRLGVSLPLESLVLEGATVAGLARRLEAARAAGARLAGARRAALNRTAPARGRPRLHAMHMGPGGLADLMPLAQALEGRAEVIGVRPPPRRDPPARMAAYGRDAAEAVAADLDRRSESAEAATLLGYSFGAMVAGEAAAALVARGLPAPRLALIDPLAPWTEPRLALRRVAEAARAGELRAAGALAGRLMGLPRVGGREAATTVAMALCAPPALPAGTRTLLVIAADDPSADRREAEWRALAGPQVEALRLPGDHLAMAGAGAAPALAAAILRFLAED
ncbi:non-ribosomal peptide synthetase [Albimonas sp. CAU 1670]|uniref:non-ribosomal peptide synthetase n=1 Tax=Albimonas sp. CAU 1670 TaxID=3032599 RepID=UPI0023DBD0C5|nr:non-ribosomal peptide synthetase [Albimonas sp. CAU 1670]MDF2231834.1 non-ribosomal peptide synthetase [Albimonas sp. CAU 1670]